jgi:hypothetical protein
MLSCHRDAESAALCIAQGCEKAGQKSNFVDMPLLEEAVAWCRMFGLEFDAVNENVAQTLEQYGTESRKISADVYIDDKACWPWMTKQEWEQYLAG